jgi:exodeoxyribonuclease V alpha subunit
MHPSETISGIIKTVQTHPSGWARINTTTDKVIVGPCINPMIGCSIEAIGQWTKHPKHGRQFKASAITATIPTDNKGLINFLSNAKIPGIGKITATKLVNYFGDTVLNNLTNETELKSVGLSPKQIASLKTNSDKLLPQSEKITVLAKAGLGTKTIAKILAFKQWNSVKSNPFIMLGKVDRLSFVDCDKLSRLLGHSDNSAFRINAGIMEAMRRELYKGHTGILKDDLLTVASNLLKNVSNEDINAQLADSLTVGVIIEFPSNSQQLFLDEVFKLETDITKQLLMLCTNIKPLATKFLQAPSDSQLSSQQLSGITNIQSNAVSIITGGPGTGKTTLLKSLCRYGVQNNLSIYLIAPTGMAATRMSDSTDMEATTIHRFLKQPPDDNELVLCIVDESSMLDTNLLLGVINRLPKRARLVLIGDVDQLPSIGFGNVLSDLIHSQKFPVTRLTKTFRFDDEIAGLAHCILSGHTPIFKTSNVTSFIECELDSTINKTVTDLKTTFPEAQVLTPCKSGMAGTEELNHALAKVINPDVTRNTIFDIGINDVVINTKNNYALEIMNGFIGVVVGLTTKTITVNYQHAGLITQDIDAAHLQLAYALTVHKVQGQEYDTVILALPNSTHIMLQQRLVYTAITRAKCKVIIVGSSKALGVVISGRFHSERLTGLKDHLGQF